MDSPPWDLFCDWLSNFLSTSSEEEAIAYFLDEMARQGKSVYFFRYYSFHKLLICKQGTSEKIDSVKGLGIDLRLGQSQFSGEELKKPNELEAIQQFVKDALSSREFLALPLTVHSSVYGIFIFLEESEKNSMIQTYLKILEQRLIQKKMEVQLEQKSHQNGIKKSLHKSEFFSLITNEISRARRIQIPVSLILLKVNLSPVLGHRLSDEDLTSFMKLTERLLRETSRVNDLVGNLGKTEFALLLPHTNIQGAAIKAERLRQLLCKNLEPRIALAAQSFFLSLGVSEYPSLCSDGDELFTSADRAMSQMEKTKKNKVCLANKYTGFQPDFLI